jgi:tripartite ATP-independent transporter DctM subunit
LSAALAARGVENGVLVAALGLLALLPLADALGRPLGFHVPGAAVYVQHLTMWLAFVGGLAATRDGKHLMLSTAEFLGEGRLQRGSRLVAFAAAAATAALLALASALLVDSNRAEARALPFGLPAWISECVMPVALGLMAWRFAWGASPTARGRALALLAVPAVFALGLAPALVAAWVWPLALAILAAGVLGAPVFVIMAALAFLWFFKDGVPITAVSAEVYRLIASPTLPAIPLLTAAGYVLAESRASERLLRFFRALFGWLPGGLAVIVACVCALFTTFTGGSGVTIIALGGLLLPILIADRYPEGFSIGLVTASGSLGLLFPPSLPVILYSVVASARDMSVPADALYLAGLLPGTLMLVLVAAYGLLVGRRLQSPLQPFSLAELAAASWHAKWELGLPLFVIALFASGSASMLETAAAGLLYAVVVECFVTRDLHLTRGLPGALVKSSALTGAVMILLSAAMGYTSYMVDALIPELLLDWVRSHISTPAVFLLALNGLLIVVGCLVDIFSAIVILAPLIAPMGALFGVHPVHLGVIFLANLELGFLTPPVGLNLFLSSSRFGKPLIEVYRHTFPFLVILALGVLVITYVPGLSLGIPSWLGKL